MVIPTLGWTTDDVEGFVAAAKEIAHDFDSNVTVTIGTDHCVEIGYFTDERPEMIYQILSVTPDE